MIRGILFDKDGTLFDFQASWGAWAAALLHRLSPDPEPLARRIGFDMATQRFAPDSPVIASTSAEVADLMLPDLPGWTKDDLLALMNRLSADAPMVEAVPLVALLDHLRARGLPLGVATNDGEAPARRQLERVGVDGRFAFIAGFDSGHGGKPAPGQLLAFCAATGLDPAHVAMVGDSAHDLHAARAAGMAAVAVLTGPALRGDLEQLADVVLNDIGELPAWLDETG
ncbi:HAD family hydrolase [Falsirhodobacter sp. 20TX0035]|uniref:HAD family hydrolase n=1 Tax=Falsirhodobacter sp. 20TX0035 TaxID=3022019 RepID=UPI00232B3B5B|nr:HAD family hydrolase [Falsirhodobacter sp. 20TX0035]MDB6452387.1 HAD family hydrolase [Falsirhodobacter sp. 20TX0035]